MDQGASQAAVHKVAESWTQLSNWAYIDILRSSGYQMYNVLNAAAAAADAKSLQSCLTLCEPVDGSPPSSAVPGILQARTLEWVAISFSNA